MKKQRKIIEFLWVLRLFIADVMDDRGDFLLYLNKVEDRAMDLFKALLQLSPYVLVHASSGFLCYEYLRTLLGNYEIFENGTFNGANLIITLIASLIFLSITFVLSLFFLQMYGWIRRDFLSIKDAVRKRREMQGWAHDREAPSPSILLPNWLPFCLRPGLAFLVTGWVSIALGPHVMVLCARKNPFQKSSFELARGLMWSVVLTVYWVLIHKGLISRVINFTHRNPRFSGWLIAITISTVLAVVVSRKLGLIRFPVWAKRPPPNS